jgi:hypothetical protein
MVTRGNQPPRWHRNGGFLKQLFFWRQKQVPSVDPNRSGSRASWGLLEVAYPTRSSSRMTRCHPLYLVVGKAATIGYISASICSYWAAFCPPSGSNFFETRLPFVVYSLQVSNSNSGTAAHCNMCIHM